MDNSTTELVLKPTNSLIDPVTSYVREAFQLANYCIICGIISFFGIGSNIVNICVFVRQGFKDSINISLLGLAISDLACSVTMFWGSICFNPLFHKLDLPIALLDVMYLSSAMPHVCFNRITSFITAFITMERCLSIAMPLKVKIMVTPYRTKVINVSIFVSVIVMFSPFYFVHKLEWNYNAVRNKTILSIVFTPEREIVDSVMFFIHSVLLSTALLLSVTVCTIILIVKLNEKSKWRNESIPQISSKPENASVKDKKVVKMITLIAIIFIVCYIPPTINFLLMSSDTNFSITGVYQNVLYVIWSVTFVLEAINSSVNIFVYFKMSSKYKYTLYGMLLVIFRKKA